MQERTPDRRTTADEPATLEPSTQRPLWLDAVRAAAFAVVLGLITGVLTSRGQTYLPDPFNQFANAYSVWLAVSFIVGIAVPRRWWAAVGGAVVQYLALVGYYVASWVFLGAPAGSVAFVLFWALGGTLGGPLLALGGFWWRTRRDIYAVAGSALVGAIFISEGAYILTILRYPVGMYFVATGIIATFLTHVTQRVMCGIE